MLKDAFVPLSSRQELGGNLYWDFSTRGLVTGAAGFYKQSLYFGRSFYETHIILYSIESKKIHDEAGEKAHACSCCVSMRISW